MGVIAEMIANDKAVEIAKNLLRQGSTIEFISEATGLDVSIILSLQTESTAA